MQLRVFGFGLLQDGDVGVGVFPEGEEVLVCSVGFGGIALESVGAGETEARECTKYKVDNDARLARSIMEDPHCGQ